MSDSVKANESPSTQETFDALLLWLEPDREKAGEIYETIRSGLIKFFECNGCRHYEEAADETLSRASKKIYEGSVTRPNNPSSYFYGIARNVLKEYWKNKERKVGDLESLPLSSHPAKNPIEEMNQQQQKQQLDRDLECLEECLAELPTEHRTLFLEYHKGEQRTRIENRNRLSELLGIAVNNLRIRIHRIGEKLEKCIVECSEKKLLLK